MRGRIVTLTLTALLFLSVVAPIIAEEDKTTKINQYVDQFIDMIPKDVELLRQVKLIKDADLTFQKSLTASVSDVLDCKNRDELRLLLGFYVFDTNYAMIFNQRK